MDLHEMTIEDLEALQQDLHQQMKKAKQQKHAVSAELDRRAAVAEVQGLLNRASPAARQLIAGAGGIVSGEQVGQPGQVGER